MITPVTPQFSSWPMKSGRPTADTRPPLLSSQLPLKSKKSTPNKSQPSAGIVEDAEAEVVPIAEVNSEVEAETPAVPEMAAEVPITEIIKAVNKIKIVPIIKLNKTKTLLARSLIKRGQEPVLMSQTMRAPGTGKKVEMRLTVPIPSTATGSASLLLGHLHERLASLELVK